MAIMEKDMGLVSLPRELVSPTAWRRAALSASQKVVKEGQENVSVVAKEGEGEISIILFP